MIEVLESGPLTTIQDAGRPGWSHLGISAGGAADPLSWAIGNALVGNTGGEAALEMTLKGGVFRFPAALEVAITGYDFSPRLDDRPVPLWKTIAIAAGQVLAFGATREGARAYLAVRGGLEAERWLGSRSTLVAAHCGGKLVRKGDRLATVPREPFGRILGASYRYHYHDLCEVLVVPGPAWSDLGESTRRLLTESEFTITEQSNRSGLRLAGPPLEMAGGAEAPSEGVTWGTLQLPASGQILVLMNEQQTTGGYPKIAHVIAHDWPKLGQLKPRDRVRFRLVDRDEAVRLLRDQDRHWRQGIA